MKFTDAQKKVTVARREKGESVRSLCSIFRAAHFIAGAKAIKRIPSPTAYLSQQEKSIKCRIAL